MNPKEHRHTPINIAGDTIEYRRTQIATENPYFRSNRHAIHVNLKPKPSPQDLPVNLEYTPTSKLLSYLSSIAGFLLRLVLLSRSLADFEVRIHNGFGFGVSKIRFWKLEFQKSSHSLSLGFDSESETKKLLLDKMSTRFWRRCSRTTTTTICGCWRWFPELRERERERERDKNVEGKGWWVLLENKFVLVYVCVCMACSKRRKE
ncbi:unnamed protein product [Lactuca virosa]|uniref:Uncharacterized protein n=1 Tax=Lactuca virosa TaxID=75947 RepID=A0AAU9MVQ0_9ASTR|nr:unnamed protein product [Lactuca virosa]